jgi:D-arginine dehydrogenase
MSRSAPGFDAVILGGGIAGATVAAHLAGAMRIALLEREPQMATHATGRSAAMFVPSYGGPEARALTAASRAFFRRATTETPALFTPRPALHVARADRLDRLDDLLRPPLDAERLSAAAALQQVPALRAEAVAGAVMERDAGEIDVAALHAHYIRQARARGAEIHTGVGSPSLARHGGAWRLDCGAGAFQAPILVNATGAWADATAAAAGVRPLGLKPRRRTLVLIDKPDHWTTERWPIVMAADGRFYFRPYNGGLLLTGCDARLSPPCDAAPDEMGVALAVARFRQALRAPFAERIRARWAGLRTFTPGGAPRIAWDDEAPGFFWVAGLGGFGVQASPAIGRLAAATILRSATTSRRASMLAEHA